MTRCVLFDRSCSARLLSARQRWFTTPAVNRVPDHISSNSSSSPLDQSPVNIQDDYEAPGASDEGFFREGSFNNVLQPDPSVTAPSRDRLKDAAINDGLEYQPPQETIEENPHLDDILPNHPDLPLSPFMIADHSITKRNHHSKKAAPSKNPTPFQIQLAKNPYARALATPIRRCPITQTWQPNYFLQGFKIKGHPITAQPWWVPEGLAKSYSQPMESPETEILGTKQLQGEGLVCDSQSTPIVPTELPQDTSLRAQNFTNFESGPTVWISSRRDLIAAIMNTELGYGPSIKSTFFGYLLQNRDSRSLVERTVWRTDMDVFLIDRIRRWARESLQNISSKRAGYISSSESLGEAILRKRQAGAIVWTGGARDSITTSGIEVEVGPQEFATIDLEPHPNPKQNTGRTKIPVHNLRTLLGPEHLSILQRECPIFENEYLVLKDKRAALRAFSLLWMLQGHLAKYSDFFTVDDATQHIQFQDALQRVLNPKAFTPRKRKDYTDFLGDKIQ